MHSQRLVVRRNWKRTRINPAPPIQLLGSPIHFDTALCSKRAAKAVGNSDLFSQTDRQTSPFPILKIERQVPLINRPLRCEKEGAKRRSSASSVHGGLAQASSAFERTPSEAARLVERPLGKAWLLAGLPKAEEDRGEKERKKWRWRSSLEQTWISLFPQSRRRSESLEAFGIISGAIPLKSRPTANF